MWQLLPAMALLLLVSSGVQAGLPKAVVILDPEWVRVLQEDSVNLTCQGAYPPGDNSTKWFHNGNRISNQDSSYVIETARVKDNGEYRCQTGGSVLSDPMRLEVHTGWLVLQTSQWVFQEGDPIRMRCHSWRNNPLHKVTYLQNGRGKRFFHQNSEFYIPEATQNDSGSYFCRGLIGSKNKSSESVNIIIQGPASPSTSLIFLPWHQLAFCLLMGLLFAVDTGLYFSMQRNLRSSKWREPEFQWSRDPQDK